LKQEGIVMSELVMKASAERAGLFRSLGNPSFALLWSGQTLSRVGDHLYEIALAWWVLQKTGSATAMATVLIFAFAPMVLFSLLGGVVVDRFSRLHVMLAADVVRGGTAVVLGLLAFRGGLEIWHVYLFSLVFGLVEAFFHPAYTAAVPAVVPEADLPSANSLSSLSIQAGRIAGPPLGAALIALGGVSLAFALNALSFFVAAVLLLPLLRRTEQFNAQFIATTAEQSLLLDFKEGIQVVLAAPWLWLSIAVFALTNITLAGPYSISLPFLVNDHLGADVRTLGFLYAFFAAGYVLSGVWLGGKAQLRQRGRLLYGGVAVAGLALFVFGLPVGFAGLALAALINGAALEISGLAWMNALQSQVPAEKLGRVASVDALGSFALLPIGYGLAGWATEWLGAPLVFMLGGGLTTLVVLLAYHHPAVRALD
jgi:MFS family permease